MMIANDVGTTSLSLFKKTPLNNSSSHIGETSTVERIPPIPANEPKASIEKRGADISALNPGMFSSANIDRYNIPYEKKTLTRTIVMRDFGVILEKILPKSCLNSRVKNLNL